MGRWIVALFLALGGAVHAAEPWETEPTKLERAELRKLAVELGGRSVDWSTVELVYLPPAALDELPPLHFRCGVSLTGPIVDADLIRLARHPGIVHLEMISAKISDAGLKQLAVLKGLQRLDVSHTAIADTGLAEIAHLKTLKQLNLVGTRVSDEGLRHLAGLKLEKLELPQEARTNIGLKNYLKAVDRFDRLESHYDWPGVTDEGMGVLEGREDLRSLTWWADKKIGLEIRRVLPTLKGLQSIHFDGAGMGDDDLRLLSKLPKLASLSIGGNAITKAGLKHLTPIKSLATLNLSGTQVTDEGMKTLAEVSSLRSLLLIRTAVTDEGIKHLAKLPNLQALDIRETRITEGGLRVFQGKKLQGIWGEPHLYTENVFLILFPNLSAEKTLNLFSWRLTDRGLKEVVKHTQLTSLAMRGEFTHEGFAGLANLSNLNSLQLNLEKQPPGAFKHIAKLSHLHHLNVWGGITDEDLVAIAKLKELSYLELRSGHYTAEGFKALGRHASLVSLTLGSLPTSIAKEVARMPNLELLSARETNLDDDGLIALGESTSLTWIDITYSSVTDKGKMAFEKKRPKCVLYEGE